MLTTCGFMKVCSVIFDLKTNFISFLTKPNPFFEIYQIKQVDRKKFSDHCKSRI